MKALLQRVSTAQVCVDGRVISSISKGLLVFLAVERGDSTDNCSYLVNKILNHRVFPDDKQHMNLSVQDVRGEILVVSQFTLAASSKKGNRPDFSNAEEPNSAKELYAEFIHMLESHKVVVRAGEFGAYMEVELVNDGPVTLLLSTN